MNIEYIVKEDNLSINHLLQNKLNISSRLLYKLIKNSLVSLNGNKCDTRNIASIGDVLFVNFDYIEDNSNIIPTKMDIQIVYEDEWILVVNKPSSIAIHPSVLHYSDSLSNGVKFYFDSIGLKKKIRPLNRLDLNTSGLVIFAKCEYVQECLNAQMKENSFKKDYLCICDGIFEEKKSTINLSIARKENSIIERCISKNGKTAITHYEVLKEFKNYSLVKCTLETGRTHQIRLHMKEIGHSLIGDSLYGLKSDLIGRQALHCYNLSFIHPISKKLLEIQASLPEDFQKLLSL